VGENMIELFRTWYDRYFSDPQAALLVTVLLLSFGCLAFFGEMLAPCLASVVIAYLLETSVGSLQRLGFGRNLAAGVIFTVFVLALILLVGGLVPLLSSQLTSFARELPGTINVWREALLRLPETYPNFLSAEQIEALTGSVRTKISSLGQNALTFSIASIPAMVTLLVYLVLGPVLVFFLLKDKTQILAWSLSYLPQDRMVLSSVWKDVDRQIGNYVRGKFYEILIVGLVAYVCFAFLGLSYAPLLAVLTGLSVIVPYIGAVVVTVPIAVAAYSQFGLVGDQFLWTMVVYGIIQALDGNLLVPLLFSDVVNLHPIAIIISILVFGGLWGFWGVFFAIPLATLVHSLLNAWPRT
jgi:putative permease